MESLLARPTDAQDLVTEIRRLEEALLRAARAEQMARRRTNSARSSLWLGIALGVLVFASDVNVILHAESWPRLVAGAILLVAVYALRDAWLRFRGAQAQLAETRAVLAELHARLRELRAHRE